MSETRRQLIDRKVKWHQQHYEACPTCNNEMFEMAMGRPMATEDIGRNFRPTMAQIRELVEASIDDDVDGDWEHPERPCKTL